MSHNRRQSDPEIESSAIITVLFDGGSRRPRRFGESDALTIMTMRNMSPTGFPARLLPRMPVANDNRPWRPLTFTPTI